MNSKRQVRGNLVHVVEIRVYLFMMLNLSIDCVTDVRDQWAAGSQRDTRAEIMDKSCP